VSGAERQQASGHHRPGRRASGGVYLPRRSAARKAGCGPRLATGQYSFSANFLENTVLIVFCSFFGQISHSFFYSNYSNERFV
jgi:hypothetical protein